MNLILKSVPTFLSLSYIQYERDISSLSGDYRPIASSSSTCIHDLSAVENMAIYGMCLRTYNQCGLFANLYVVRDINKHLSRLAVSNSSLPGVFTAVFCMLTKETI